MVPAEFGSVEECPIEVLNGSIGSFHASLAQQRQQSHCLGLAGETCECSRIGVLQQLLRRRRIELDNPGELIGDSLDSSLANSPFILRERLLNRASAVFQFIDSRVAKLLYKALLLTKPSCPDEQMRVLVNGFPHDSPAASKPITCSGRSRTKGNIAQRDSRMFHLLTSGIEFGTVQDRRICLCDVGMRRVAAECLRQRDHQYESTEVAVMISKVSSEAVQQVELLSVARIIRVRQIVDRFDGPGPDRLFCLRHPWYRSEHDVPADDRTGRPQTRFHDSEVEPKVVAMRRPGHQAVPGSASLRQPVCMKRHRRRDLPCWLRFFFFESSSVAAGYRRLPAATDRADQSARQPFILRLCPVVERVIMTLGTVDAHCPRKARETRAVN